MDFDEAFGEDVTPGEFVLENLPELHRERLENFGRFCETTLRFCIHLTDLGERYSVELQPDGARSREGEFIDFPVATIEGTTGPWEVVRSYTHRAFERGERALERQPPPNRIDEEFLRDFERFDGVIEVVLEFPELETPAEFRIVLNDYDPPPDARTIQVHVGSEIFEDLKEGRRSPDQALQSADVSGDMSLAFDLSGVVLQHFPELEN